MWTTEKIHTELEVMYDKVYDIRKAYREGTSTILDVPTHLEIFSVSICNLNEIVRQLTVRLEERGIVDPMVSPVPVESIANVKVGDTVVRFLGGVVPQELKVTEVTELLVRCGDWTFDLKTGAEVDDDLGWGPPPKTTGSYIQKLVAGTVKTV